MALWLMTGLLVKHFVCDFPFQTAAMRRDKGRYLELGGIHHAFAHGLGTAAVFTLCGLTAMAGTMAILDILIHYHVDYLKSRINSWRSLDHQKDEFWNLLGLDQLAHQLTYVLLVALALSVSHQV